MVALRKSSNSWLVSLVTLILSCSLFVRLASSDWQSIDLMANRVYRLHWRLDGEQLRFRVEVKSRGYFSLGVSPTGTMTSADLVTGYIHANGSAILHDRFSKGRTMPEIDAQQDWQLVSGNRNETHLMFEFWRPLTTSDSNDDLPIDPANKIHLIYAFGKVDPKDRSRVKYHGPKSRGSYELELE